jgi:2-dehydropantoate 2-reductase
VRFLTVGAGAVGGYFGGRLVQQGEDVTFLVRPRRRQELEQTGLVIHSVHGDYAAPVKTLVTGEAAEPFDVILLSVKAYHLDAIMDDLAPYVTEGTMILPLLNGYDHLARLYKHFGAEHVLGGLCHLETTLNEKGEIVQTSPRHDITFGEWDGSLSPRVQAVQERFEKANFVSILSDKVQTDVWLKYIFIASLSGITTLMKSHVGPIFADPNGVDVFKKLVREIASIAHLVGAPVPEQVAEAVIEGSLALPAPFKASMLRDLEKGLAVEADHIQGALLNLAEAHGRSRADYPVLQAAYANLKVYEQNREQA